MVDIATLKKRFPKANNKLLEPIVDYCNGSDPRMIKCHFLAQLAHESDGFKTVEEYASGKAYEGRKDLGNIHPGDGVKYKGRGYIQLTGRANYIAASKALNIDLLNHPEALLEPTNAFNVSAWFWNSRGLNSLALSDDLVKITKKINGGLNGLPNRKLCLQYFKGIINV